MLKEYGFYYIGVKENKRELIFKRLILIQIELLRDNCMLVRTKL